MRVQILSASLAALIGVAAAPAQAAVVSGPTIDGLATFIDTNTDRTWLKLNDFFGETGDQMIATATAAGFTAATSADVMALTNTLPLDGTATTWDSYASVMGSAPNRDLMWGAYVPDPAADLGWAYAYSTDTSWTFVDGAYPANEVPNGVDSPYADENLWAYQTGSAIPELSTWAMMMIGFAGLGFAGYRGARGTAALAG